MEIIIGILSACVGVAMFIVTWLYFKPVKTSIDSFKEALQTSIQGLQKTMEKLADAVENLRKDSTATQIHVAELEQSVKSAHKRIDNLCERVHDMEQRCVNCTCRKE